MADVFQLLGKIAVDTDDAVKAMDDTSKKGKSTESKLTQSFKNIGKAVAAYFTVSTITNFGKSLVDLAAGAEQSAAKVNTLLKGRTNTDAYFKDMLDASTATGVSMTEFAEATYQAISASVDQSKAVDFVTDAIKLAKGGFTDTTTAVDILTTTLNAYNDESLTAAHVSDVLLMTQNLGKTSVDELASSMGKVIPIASAYGVNVENLGAAYATLTAGGIATAESTTYMKSMLTELAKDGSKVSTIIKTQTGSSFTELMEKGYSLGDVIEFLYKCVGEDATAFAQLWSSTEAGTGALAIANAGAEQYNNTLDQMQNSAGATDKAYKKMTQTLSERMAKLKNVFTNAGISIGKKFIPAIGNIVDGITNWAVPAFEKFESYFVGVFGENGSFNFEKFGEGITNMFKDIGKKIPSLLSGLKTAITSGIGNLWDMLKGILKIAFGVELPDWGVVSAAVTAWWSGENGVMSKIKNVCNWVLNVFGLPEDTDVLKAVGVWWTGVVSSVQDACSWVLGIFSSVEGNKDSVQLKVQAWWTRVKTGAIAACKWVLGIFTNPAKNADDVKEKVGEWWALVKSGATDACDWLLNVFNGVDGDESTVGNAVNTWWNGVKKAAAEACNWVLGLFGMPEDTEKSIGNKIGLWWQGVKKSAVDACNWALGIFTNPEKNENDVENVVGKWWEKVKSGATAACTWVLGLFSEPTTNENQINNVVNSWWQNVVGFVTGVCTWVLGLFSEPTTDETTIKGVVDVWWKNVVDFVVTTCTWVLGLFGQPTTDEKTITDVIDPWWQMVVGFVTSTCNWVLGLFSEPTTDETTINGVVDGWWQKVKDFVVNTCIWALGLFGEPTTDETTIRNIVDEWWKKVRGFVTGACNWVLGLFSEPTTDESKIKPVIDGWWQNVSNVVTGACEWFLNVFTGVDESGKSADEIVGNWWDGIKQAVVGACTWVLSIFEPPEANEGEITNVVGKWFSGITNTVSTACKWVLGLFDDVEGNETSIGDVVGAWWQGKKNAAVSACEWVLGLFGVPKETSDAVGTVIGGWFETVKDGATKACNWVLGIFTNPSETADDMKTTLSPWWTQVEDAVSNACEWTLGLFGLKDDVTQENIDTIFSGWWPTIAGYIGNATQWTLQMFGLPEKDASAINALFTTWWSSIGEIAGAVCTIVCGVKGQDVSTVGRKLFKWGEETSKALYDQVHVDIDGGSIIFATGQEIAKKIGVWWEEIKKDVVDLVLNVGVNLKVLALDVTEEIRNDPHFFDGTQALDWLKKYANKNISYDDLQYYMEQLGLEIPADVEVDDTAKAAMLSDINTWLATNPVKLTAEVAAKWSWMTAWDGEGNEGVEGHANGLEFVNRDRMPALLHYGEAVLNRTEARAWREGRTKDGTKPESVNNNSLNVGTINLSRDIDVDSFFSQYDDFVTRKQRGYGWG